MTAARQIPAVAEVPDRQMLVKMDEGDQKSAHRGPLSINCSADALKIAEAPFLGIS